MSESQYILLTINNSHKRIKVYIYNEGDNLNWISKHSFNVEPGHQELYQSNGPYKYQVRSNKLNDVVLLKRNIKLKVGSTGCVNTYFPLDKELKEANKVSAIITAKEDVANQTVAIYTAKEGDDNNNLDCFEVLGLERTITKNEKEEKDFQKKLKTNYHEKIRKYHPDRNPDPTGNNERISKELILAYDILSDKYRRARYINLMDSNSLRYILKFIYWPEPTTPEEEENRWSSLAERLSITFVSVALLYSGGVAAVAAAETLVSSGYVVPVGAALLTKSVLYSALDYKKD